MLNKDKPIAIMLIGVPGSGKSTYYEEFLSRDYSHYISSDAYIEKKAAEQGTSYGAIFNTLIKVATKWMEEQLQIAIDAYKSLVWDQTNLSRKARRHKLDMLIAAGYAVHAIAFEIPEDELERRRTKRQAETGKSIPQSILQTMGNSYERPTMVEGFSKVTIITPDGELEV